MQPRRKGTLLYGLWNVLQAKGAFLRGSFTGNPLEGKFTALAIKCIVQFFFISTVVTKEAIFELIVADLPWLHILEKVVSVALGFKILSVHELLYQVLGHVTFEMEE